MTDRPIRVLCVDDNLMLSEALSLKLDVEDDIQCVGRLPSADSLVEWLRDHDADVILLDVEMPGRDPFEALREAVETRPQVRTIILSAHLRDEYIDAAVASGAWGYVCKGDRADAIVQAVRKVSSGEFVLGPEVANHCRRSTGVGGGV